MNDTTPLADALAELLETDPQPISNDPAEQDEFPTAALGALADPARASSRAHAADLGLSSLLSLASGNAAIYDTVRVDDIKGVCPVGLYVLAGAPTAAEKGTSWRDLMGAVEQFDRDLREAQRRENARRKKEHGDRRGQPDMKPDPRRFRHNTTSAAWLKRQGEVERPIGLLNTDSGMLVGWSMRKEQREFHAILCAVFAGEGQDFLRAKGSGNEGSPDLDLPDPRPHITFCPQPDVMRAFYASPVTVESGLGNRFLAGEFAIVPEAGTGHSRNHPAIKEHRRRLMELMEKEPRTRRFNVAANKELNHRVGELKLAAFKAVEAGDAAEGVKVKLMGRYPEIAARVAVTLAEYEGHAGPIDLALYERGLEVAEWGNAARQRLYESSTGDEADESLVNLLRWMRGKASDGEYEVHDSGCWTMPIRDLYRGRMTANQCSDLLDEAEKHNWGVRGKMGRQRVWFLHARALEHEPAMERKVPDHEPA